jgi:hypothetical protein
MRRASNLDSNHIRICQALRAIGASVQSLASMGGGVPDLLVGYHGRNILLEVKDGEKPPSARVLTRQEDDWHVSWAGQVSIVYNEEQAQLAVIKAVGL